MRHSPGIGVGTRIGAIYSMTYITAKFIGYGVYAGYEVPPADVGGETQQLAEHGIPDHRLCLDSGETIWGSQCRWAHEDVVARKLAMLDVTNVNVKGEVRDGI